MNDLLNGYTQESILELFEKSGKKNPVITINNKEYTLGIGINDADLADVIRDDEMRDNITKICFNPSLSYYYVVGPEYYNNINYKIYEWIGEQKSKLNKKYVPIKFGFGRNKSALTRYEF